MNGYPFSSFEPSSRDRERETDTEREREYDEVA
jgi:hypothetical protein